MPLTDGARGLFASPVGAFRRIGEALTVTERKARVSTCSDVAVLTDVMTDDSVQHEVRMAARARLAELKAEARVDP